MAVRTLPNLQPVVDAHKHVALPDERLTGHAWLAVGAAKSILVDVPCGAWTLWDRFVADATSREAWTVGWLATTCLCLGMTWAKPPMLPATPHRTPAVFLLALVGARIPVGAPGELQPSVVRGGLAVGPGCAGVPRRTSSEPQNPEVQEGDWQPLTPGWDRPRTSTSSTPSKPR